SGAFEGLGLGGDTAPAAGGGVSVRTCFAEPLLALANRWSARGGKTAPAGLVLDGARLRWWSLAAGSAAPGRYLLGLGAQDEQVWGPVGAALAGAGLPATFLGPRADGPAYRLTGQRRLERLRELVGEPPDGVPASGWPGDDR
ncbi:MAG: hypothetical protein LC640_12965, partial [Frankia sp.]|nr:hypothetical protein [Frankia sp.]